MFWIFWRIFGHTYIAEFLKKQILCFAVFRLFLTDFRVFSIFWIFLIFWFVRTFRVFSIFRTFWIVRLFQAFRLCDIFHKLVVRIIRIVWKLLKLSEYLNFIYFWFYAWRRETSRGTIDTRGDFYGLITISYMSLKVKLLENVLIFRQFRIV